MIRKSSWVIGALFVLILATPCFGSNGTQIGTVGARSTAMASAFRGLSDDWSAVFFNPAGLTQLDKLTIGFSGGIIMPRGSYEPAHYSIYPTHSLITDEVNVVEKDFFVPALGIFYKPIEKLVVGVGVYAPFGLGTEWDLMNLSEEYGNSIGFSKKNEHYSDHQVITIQPTAAYQLSEKLSVGLGVSYIMGKMTIDQVVMPINPLAEVSEVMPGVRMSGWQAIQAGLAQMGVTMPDMQPDQNRLAVENHLSGDGSAMGINVGLLYKATDKLSIGLSARYCTDLALSGTIEQSTILPSDSAISATLTALSAMGVEALGTTPIQQVQQLFSGIISKESWDVKADLPLPLTAGIGLAYKATPKLTLVADASMTNWATWDEITVEAETPGQDNLIMKEGWKNTVEIGAGLEYQASESLALRGGLYTVDTPAPESTISPTILDPIRRWVLTGGIGYKVGKLALNLTAEWIMFKDKEMIANDYVYDDLGIPENYAGIYKFSALVTTFGAQIEL